MKKKVIPVIGTRPNLIKYAAVFSELTRHFRVQTVDTDQHYDAPVAGNLWKEFRLPKPLYSLKVGSGPHGRQTGKMLERIEPILFTEKPDAVVVFGDTNSAFAGALAAVKLHIPIAHIEAGVRSGDRRMPEEINRILIDHIATLRFCPTRTAMTNLRQEGIRDGNYLVGDVHYELLYKTLLTMKISRPSSIKMPPWTFSLVTIHRPENTDSKLRLMNIFRAIAQIEDKFLFPIHPRTRKMIKRFSLSLPGNVKQINPVSYKEMLVLEKQANIILSDSGGVQREAFWLGRPCLILRLSTEWPETIQYGNSLLVGWKTKSILSSYQKVVGQKKPRPQLSHTVSAKIVRAMAVFLH